MIRLRRSLSILVIAAAACAVATPAARATERGPARILFVAATGSDSGSGSLRRPLASIQAAADRLRDGGTVLVRGGRYGQRVDLDGARNLTIAAFPGEHVVLDGSTLTPPAGRSAMVSIKDSRRIVVTGLDITGYRTTSMDAVPIGIYVHGASAHIALRRNHVHDLGNDNPTLGSFDINAHGIAVYGDSPQHSIHDLTIADNVVDHLTLGASESVVVNGNVDGWRIVGNRIHDNNNIGIDAIGFEPTLGPPYRYTQANRARHGYIGDNTVYNIISKGNPSYYEDGSWCNCADGIYIDGGSHITIDRNIVYQDDIGIEVAAENAKGRADHVRVHDNFIHDSKYVGITTGGYCNGTADCGGVQTGKSYDNTFVNNTLYHDNTLNDGSPEFLIQYYAYDNRVENNIIFAADADDSVLGTVPGVQSDGVSNRNYIDDNLYFTSDGRSSQAKFGSLAMTYTGWQSYQAATGLDVHSRFVDPRLSNLPGRDLHLRWSSPAINSGRQLRPGRTGDRDIDGQPRTLGGHIDIGADEFRWTP